jgi:hypothetical protein
MTMTGEIGGRTRVPDPGNVPTKGEVEAALDGLDQQPELEELPDLTVMLPSGLVDGEDLIQHAIVRELNGFDEEKLSRLDMDKNPAIFTTKLLAMAVESIGSRTPNEETIRQLLMGDRDALVVGIRRATYGNLVPFKLTCSECEQLSQVDIELDKDIEVQIPEDPRKREFEVPLRRGAIAKIALINGAAQEAFSEGQSKKTQAEINSLILARTLISIDGVPTHGSEETSKRLSLADRDTLIDWIAQNQPGPQLQKEIRVHCATCDAEYPIFLGTLNLFRF